MRINNNMYNVSSLQFFIILKASDTASKKEPGNWNQPLETALVVLHPIFV